MSEQDKVETLPHNRVADAVYQAAGADTQLTPWLQNRFTLAVEPWPWGIEAERIRLPQGFVFYWSFWHRLQKLSRKP